MYPPQYSSQPYFIAISFLYYVRQCLLWSGWCKELPLSEALRGLFDPADDGSRSRCAFHRDQSGDYNDIGAKISKLPVSDGVKIPENTFNKVSTLWTRQIYLENNLNYGRFWNFRTLVIDDDHLQRIPGTRLHFKQQLVESSSYV